ncbi:class I SAM-dependent methyltransferase [Scopulibacillus cellulosilyticus]|uniref:Class I SAM-dependent methyltransferase n=1 Tax=Scopulibacillus cellulosilyticus TaxID=2665665 RepID=A0ABW2PSV5_9BACL
MPGEEFDELVDFFDRMAQTKWLSTIHEQLINQTGSWNGLSVLDVGCGTGRLLLKGGKNAERLTGIDLSSKMIDRCRKLAGEADYQHCEFLVGDAYHLPFKDESFDLALSTCVMFLLPEPEKGVGEIVRVIKPGGKMAMLNPSVHMTEQAASGYCSKHQIKDFEKTAMKQWSKVATRRHSYDEGALNTLLTSLGFGSVEHLPVLDGLAFITTAKKAK